ncbi:MAG: phenylacetic acid degradation-related protein [Nitrospirae bacterium]|nr:phenylacetic acid degradation-related protein [Nitrospirota bacterium]
MRHTLEDDHYCFVCGENNPSGLHLKFFIQEGKVFTEFIPRKIHQGYKDIIHGGLISTILDEAMVKAALMQGIPAVTAELTVRFRNPLLAGEKAIIEAAILKSNRKIIEATALIKKTDETVIAEGTAKLLRQD